MSSIHSASLVEASSHSDAMLELLELPIDRKLIEHLVHATVETVEFAHGGPHSAYSKTTPGFTQFVSNVVTRSEVNIGALLVALVYIQRSKPYLSLETDEWAFERVFLGSLVLAAKYTSDSTLKNVHWALVTGIFGKRDIGRMEREFLEVLDWDLAVSEADILYHHDSLMVLHPQARKLASLITTPVLLSPHSNDYSSSDSDSDCSTSPSPLTPATPQHQPTFTKAPQHSTSSKQPFHLSHIFTNPWRSSNQVRAAA